MKNTIPILLLLGVFIAETLPRAFAITGHNAEVVSPVILEKPSGLRIPFATGLTSAADVYAKALDAQGVAVAGDRVLVTSDMDIGNTALGKAGVNWYFEPVTVAVTGSAEAAFHVTTDADFVVDGMATFSGGVRSVCIVDHDSADVTIRGKYSTVTGNNVTAFHPRDGTLRINMSDGITTSYDCIWNGYYSSAADLTKDGRCFYDGGPLTATGAGGDCIEVDGGVVVANVVGKMQTAGSTTVCINGLRGVISVTAAQMLPTGAATIPIVVFSPCTVSVTCPNITGTPLNLGGTLNLKQAYDADLTTYAGITPSANVQTLLGSATFAAARTNLQVNKKSIGHVFTASPLSTGNGKDSFTIPPMLNNFNVTAVYVSVGTAGTTGTTDFQITRTRGGSTVDIFTTGPKIASTKTFNTDSGGTAGTVNTSNDDLQTGDKISIDVDAVSTTPPEGPIQYILECTEQ